MKRLLFTSLVKFAAALSISGSVWAEPLELEYRQVDVQPHNTDSFTQGLMQQGDILTETSGLYGKSFIAQYHADTGEVLRHMLLPKDIFAEGVTGLGDALYMLTWKAGKMFVLDPQTLVTRQTVSYQGEGWGLTHNGRSLIMSDGSDMLHFRDPETFEVERTLTVHSSGRSWSRLNELVYAQGLIWANVWQSSYILAIDPDSGEVKGVANFAELEAENSTRPGHTVLNGIAFDEATKTYWVTGKLWPKRYRVEFIWPQ